MAALFVVGLCAVLWATFAEWLRRRFGRPSLLIVTTIVATLVGFRVFVSIRPRVAPDPASPLAYAAVFVMVASIFVVPSLVVSRADKESLSSFARQVCLGALAGVATLLVVFLLAYLGVFS